MTIESMQPFVRYAHSIVQFIPDRVIAPDHRIFYCTAGCAEISVKNETHTLSRGDLLYISAGVPYRGAHTQGDFAAFALNFDFGQSMAHIFTAVPPIYEDKLTAFLPVENEAPPLEFHAPVLVKGFGEGERYIRDIEHEYRHKKLYAEKRTSLLLSSLLILALRRTAASEAPGFSRLATLRHQKKCPTLRLSINIEKIHITIAILKL